MKTYKYYKIDSKFEVPTPDENSEVDVIPYSETIIGVNAEDHSTLDYLSNLTEQTYEEAVDVLEESHLNKQLNKELVNRIREKYSIDDEIAIRLKDATDPKRVKMESYIDGIKNEISAKKIKYGLK